VDDTLQALQMGAVEILIVWERPRAQPLHAQGQQGQASTPRPLPLHATAQCVPLSLLLPLRASQGREPPAVMFPCRTRAGPSSVCLPACVPVQNAVTGAEVIKILSKEQEADPTQFKDAESGAELEVQEKKSLLEWFAEECRRVRVHPRVCDQQVARGVGVLPGVWGDWGILGTRWT